MPYIEIPCNLGDIVYHIHKCKMSKGQPQAFHVTKSVVAAIHFGRKLYTTSPHSDTYIRLADPTTGYMSARISFSEFETDCFKTSQEAYTEAKRRAELVCGVYY